MNGDRRNIPAPPPGFVLEEALPIGSDRVPPPPPGFMLVPSSGGANQQMPTGDDDPLSRLRTATGGLLEGIPVVGPLLRGGVERAAAGTIAALSPDHDYAQVLDVIQQGSEREKRSNPVLDASSQVAGAVAGTLPLVMAAPAAFGAGGGSLLARSGASAVSGTALGGADAAVRSGGDPRAVADGMMWGGSLGLAGPLAGQAVGSGIRAVAGRSGTKASKAQRALSRAAGADAVDDISGRLAAMGGPAMPMDLGPNLQRQAGALAATPGRGQEIVRSAIAERQSGAGARMGDVLDSALGQPVDTLAMAEGIIARRSSAARPLYERAYLEGADGIMSPEIQRLASSPMFASAMRSAAMRGQDRAVLDGFGSFNPRVTVTEDGRIVFNQSRPGGTPLFPDLQFWDYVKRELDDIAGAARRAGRNGEAQTASQMAKKLRGELDEAVPTYRAARDAFAGSTAVLEALEEGQQAFSRSLTPAQLRAHLTEMGAAEREAFIQGARAEIAKIMGTARNDALAARSIFDRGWNKEKLEILVGREQAGRLLAALDAETAFARTRDVVAGNSETAARMSAQSEIGGAQSRPGILRSAMNMRFGDALADAGDWAIGGVRAAAQQQTNDELATLLTSRDPRAITRAIRIVQQAQRRGDISAQRAREITQALTLSGAQRKQPLEITVTPSR